MEKGKWASRLTRTQLPYLDRTNFIIIFFFRIYVWPLFNEIPGYNKDLKIPFKKKKLVYFGEIGAADYKFGFCTRREER